MEYPPNDVPAFAFWLMPDEDPLDVGVICSHHLTRHDVRARFVS